MSLIVRSAAPEARIRELIAIVESVAEIPRAIRESPPITIDAHVEPPAG